MMRAFKRTEAGFTLLEVLASVVILGLGVATVMRLFSGSISLARASSQAAGKTLFAREKMKEVLLDENTTEMRQSGSADGFDWVFKVTEAGEEGQVGLKLFNVELTVNGRGGAPVMLTTTMIDLPAR